MKTAIVTGSSGNLGQAVVHKFISEGYRVIGTVTHEVNDTKNYPADQYESVLVDVSKEEEARSFVEESVKKYGNIDAAILTVGGFASGTVAETGTSEIMKQYQLNFETTYNVARPLFVQMTQHHSGRIFFIGSKAGLEAKSSRGLAAYGLAKSLLFRLAELMNDEGAKHNVVTSMVVPGTIDTAANRNAMPEADFSSWVKPEAIADVIYFYCTDAASALREPVIKLYNNA